MRLSPEEEEEGRSEFKARGTTTREENPKKGSSKRGSLTVLLCLSMLIGQNRRVTQEGSQNVVIFSVYLARTAVQQAILGREEGRSRDVPSTFFSILALPCSDGHGMHVIDRNAGDSRSTLSFPFPLSFFSSYLNFGSGLFRLPTSHDTTKLNVWASYCRNYEIPPIT